MTKPRELLRIENLTVAFRERGRVLHAVRGADLSLSAGERLALIGESGSGKTTIALALAGLLPEGAERSGAIAWDASASAPVAGRDIGVVFQDPMSSLNPVLDVHEQIAEVLVAHRALSWAQARERADLLLERVGLPGLRARGRVFPHRLSGGQRQRVAIAMAIAAEPRLLIADEPTSALDTVTQREIVALIDRLARDTGMALLLVTHDLALAHGIAETGAVAYAGRIVERGPIARLLTAPRHPYTQALLAASLDLDSPRGRRLAEIPGQAPSPAERPAGCPFAPRCRHALASCAHTAPAWRGAAGDGAACVLHAAEPAHA